MASQSPRRRPTGRLQALRPRAATKRNTCSAWPSAAFRRTTSPTSEARPSQTITWSIVSGFKGLENDVVILAGLTDIEADWHRGVAYVGMSRARTRLHVVIHEDCDGKRREREGEWRERQESDVEMLL